MRVRLLCFAALAALAACQDPPSIVVPDSPSTVGKIITDLPAPQGFEYEKNISDTNPTGAFRVITQELKGPEQRVEAAARFYRDAFPRHQWVLEKDEGDGKSAATFVFTKKDERCRVDVRDVSPSLVRITVKVTRKD